MPAAELSAVAGGDSTGGQVQGQVWLNEPPPPTRNRMMLPVNGRQLSAVFLGVVLVYLACRKLQ